MKTFLRPTALWLLGITAILSAVGLTYAGSKSMRGTVVSVDAEENKITITDSFSSEEKVLKITKASKFYGEKKNLADIGAVKPGQIVSVMYDPDLGNKLSTLRVMSSGVSTDVEPKVAKSKKKPAKKPVDEDADDEPKVASKKKPAQDDEDSEETTTTKKGPKFAFASSGKPEKDKLMPEITGKDLDGKSFKLSDYAGKVILVDFWGDWCGYCMKMVPDDRKLVEKNKSKPFAFVGVNTDETVDRAKKSVSKNKINWRSFYDGKSRKISGSMGITGYPTLVLIDHKGIVRQIFVGYKEGEVIEKAVAELVKKVPKDKKDDSEEMASAE